MDTAQQLGRLCAGAPDLTSAEARRHVADCCSQPRPAVAHAVVASLHRRACPRPFGLTDLAAKRAALAGWTVSAGPDGWKATPGRVARVLTSRVSASR